MWDTQACCWDVKLPTSNKQQSFLLTACCCRCVQHWCGDGGFVRCTGVHLCRETAFWWPAWQHRPQSWWRRLPQTSRRKQPSVTMKTPACHKDLPLSPPLTPTHLLWQPMMTPIFRNGYRTSAKTVVLKSWTLKQYWHWVIRLSFSSLHCDYIS